jgi:hypothetical protein
MRLRHLGWLLAAISVISAISAISMTAMIAQDTQPVGAALKAAPKTVTLVGCIARGSTPNQLTINDSQSGRFQLSGSRLSRYVGQRVELAGNPDTSRLRIRGGLTPTPNIAGQAGAIDPVRAAVAAQPGGGSAGTGDASLPNFRVKSIKTIGGPCE